MPRLLLAALVLLSACSAPAQDLKKGVLDPENAGPDFALQGEYVGKVGGDNGRTWGVQVIALGDGKFRAVGYNGGLPGDGWTGDPPTKAEAEAKDGRIEFVTDEGNGVVKDGKLIVVLGDKLLGTLNKVERKSPTLGKEPPEGAVVLYGGPEDTEKWKGGKADENGLLQQGVTSKQTFGKPFTLHMEFQLSFMPHGRGQGRSNSGVYLQGRHEVQILDSFGLEGKHNECGGLYSVKDPDVNMCLPPLAWQTYDVDFTPATYGKNGNRLGNARITVRHNGVVVHEDVELEKTSTAAPVKVGQEPGPIYIQNHSNPLRFRNVWVLEK